MFACNALECGDPSPVESVSVQKIPAQDVVWRKPFTNEVLRVGQQKTLTVSVNGGGTAISSVRFYRNQVSDSGSYYIGVATDIDSSVDQCDNCYSLNWLSVAADTNKLIAVVMNEAGKESTKELPVTVDTNTPPEVGLDLDALPTKVFQGQVVTLVARARDLDGSIDTNRVEFLLDSDTNVIGSGTHIGVENGWHKFELEWTVPQAGSYSMGVRAYDSEAAPTQTFQQVTFEALQPPEPPATIDVTGITSGNEFSLRNGDTFTGDYYRVAWEAVAGATHYRLDEVHDGDFETSESYDAFAPVVTVPNRAHGHYLYRAVACNAAGCSDELEPPQWGPEFSVDVVRIAPQAPAGLRAGSLHPEFDITSRIALHWNAVTSAPEPRYYLLEEKPGGVDGSGSWTEVGRLSHSSEAEFAPHLAVSDRTPGIYSYRVNACNAETSCSTDGEIVTVQVVPPVLLSAEGACEGQCLRVAGSGLDPDAFFTLTNLRTGDQQLIEKSKVNWQPPVTDGPIEQRNLTTYAELPFSAVMRRAFEEQDGVHIAVEIPRGERAAVNAYGNKTVERLSQIDSSPTVGADGTVYVGSGSKVYALDPEDGSVRSGWPFFTQDVVKATPTIDSVNGNIYVGSLDGHLYALTPNGLEQWRVQTGGDLVASAVLDENRILYQGSMDGAIYAVQAQNGAVQWTYPAGAGIAETPVLAGNGTLYFTTVGSSQIHALGRGVLGPDQLVWESRDESLLADSMASLDWQPSERERPEYKMATRLYRLLLQPPLSLSRDVLTFWTSALVIGASPEEVAGAFLASDTGVANFPPTQNHAAFVDQLYERAFPGQGQPAFTHAGQLYTRNSLLDVMAGGASRADVAMLFAESVQYITATSELLNRSFEYMYVQDYSWAVFSCDEGDEYTRDCDSDDLPDYWEILYFGSDSVERGDSDADGDGVSNRDAFLAGIDPCANLCRNGVIAEAPSPALTPMLDSGELAISAQTGSLPGKFRVNEAGAASYSIPLSLPAGTAGVVPDISLNYSSQSGNGLVGYGWGIGGLSAVTRCRQTLGQDGQARPITWTAEDRFCLDGQRLLVVEGEYGEPGSRYRTEIDSFALMQAHGGEAGNPAYFTVERKDGSISYYGRDGDARQDTGQGTLSWAISTFEDSVGNRIEFIYASDGGQRVREIRYAYVSPGRSRDTGYGARVIFDYESRSDPIRGYTAGELLETRKRLTTVRIHNSSGSGMQEVRRYELGYLNYPADRLSRLERIRQCADELCQPDTIFDWRLPLPGSFAASASDSVTLSNQEDRVAVGTRPADINGDGRMDLIWLEPDFDPDGNGGSEVDYQWFKYVLAEDDGFGPELSVYREDDDTSRPYEWQMIDYNGDGRADLVTYLNDRKHWGIVVAQPDADGEWTLSGSPRYLPELTERNAKFLDLNGDGLADYLAGNNYRLLEPSASPSSSTYYRFSDSQVAKLDVDWDLVEFGGYQRRDSEDLSVRISSETSPADFNGDGILDPVALLRVTDNCYRDGAAGDAECEYHRGLMVMASSGVGDYGSYAFLGDVLTAEPVDINGDGLPDIVYRRGESGYYRINSGQQFGDEVSLGELPKHRQYFDYDNDGDNDLAWHDHEAGRLKIRRWHSLEQRFGEPESFLQTSRNENALHIFVDMNGDGVNDYIRVENDRAYLYPATEFRVPVNVVEKITNGLGAETDIAYGSLTSSGHYKRRDISPTTEERCESANYDDGRLGPRNGSLREWCRDYAVADLAKYYGYLNDPWEGEDRLGKLSPTLELMGPMYVVTRVDSSAPVAGDPESKSAVSYYYAQARVQAGGRGMLGFEQLTTVDEQTGVETTTTYRQDFPFQGYPQSTEVRSAQGHLLSESRNSWRLKNAGGTAWQENWPARARENGSGDLGPLQPWLERTEETSYELVQNGAAKGSVMKSVVTDNEYDSHGNPQSIVVTTSGSSDTFVTATTNEYGPGRSLSLGSGRTLSTFAELGRLTRTEVEHSRTVDGVADSELRISEFDYYTSGNWSGLLKEEVIEPDAEDATLTLTTTYTYDDFGNKTSITRSTEGEVSRSSYSFFKGGRGRYLEREENVYGQVIQRVEERNHLGQPVHVIDMAGVASFHQYDAFGRKVLDYSATGAHSITLLAAAGSHCPDGAAYQQVTRKAGGGESLTCFDVLARETRSATRGFDGQWVYADTEYDNLGRVTRKSEPYRGSPGAGQYWTAMKYDILGRITGTDMPGAVSNNGYGVDVHVEYRGYTTVTTNPEGHTKTETKNARGELVNVQDNLNGIIEYRYDAQGNLRFVTRRSADSGIVPVTEMRYDKLGRKVYMNDPDKGEWSYGYNGFGELAWQLDAKNQQVVNQYDQLGRLVRRIDYLEGGGVEGDTYWTYNNDPDWQYPLEGLAIPPGALENVMELESGFIQHHSYDAYGRTEITSTDQNMDEAGDEYVQRVTYDQYGRSFQQFDAAGDGFTSSATENRYNNFGYLEAVVDAEVINQASAVNYYTVLEMDERGNVTRSVQGNGVTTVREYAPATGRLERQTASVLGVSQVQDLSYEWDNLGNLESRHERSGNKDLFEDFDYDGLNRLRSAQVSGRVAQTVEYDGFGNIEYKSDVGHYLYGDECATGYGLGAICETTDGVAYHYDASGNMISDSSGRRLQYSTFDKPVLIQKGGHTTEFKYGPDRSRYLRVDTDNNGIRTETRYIGNVEKITRSDGFRETKRYLPGGAIVTLMIDSDGSNRRASRYLHKDHLGSIDMITDSSGTVLQEMSFDAWGQRRNAQSWEALVNADLAGFDTRLTPRGYTGHEMLDQVGLVHMNGRIYDARLGRLMQADPFVQAASDTQMFNRYSYVRNNPLNATDPSGYFVFTLGTALWLAAAEGVKWYTVGLIMGAAGFTDAMAQGASFKQALKSGVIQGISAAAFAGVGEYFSGVEAANNQQWAGFLEATGMETVGLTAGQTAAKMAAHALVGGVMSIIRGGKFGHGFASAGITQAFAGKIGGIGGSATTSGYFSVTNRVLRVTAAAVIGGTTTKISGGKFSNGALSAAFSRAFNDELAHPPGSGCSVPMSCAGHPTTSAGALLGYAGYTLEKSQLGRVGVTATGKFKYSVMGWAGNQYVKMHDIAEFGKGLGPLAFGFESYGNYMSFRSGGDKAIFAIDQTMTIIGMRLPLLGAGYSLAPIVGPQVLDAAIRIGPQPTLSHPDRYDDLRNAIDAMYFD
ncbi:RHS repeat-associated core domain-containing protein [Microbulbifer guangxiensis]|uniref:RHS repeat-associated core domain-containing protein n=1 Tax=Microbulbifer guangxiensis TaxID=2904249 RepID=UPI001F384AAF